MPQPRGAVRLILGDGTLPPVPFTAVPGKGPPVEARSGEATRLPAGPARLEGSSPLAWSLAVDVTAGAEIQVALRAQVRVLMADAGGRELGGLPLAAHWLDGDVALTPGRLASPLVVPPGRIRLSIPVEPPQEVEITLAPGEERTLDLGRLASVVIELTRPDQKVTRGIPLTLATAQGAAVAGRVGEEIQLWPGAYRLTVRDAGELATPAPRDVTLPAGALTEIELGTSPASQGALLLAREVGGALRTVARRAAARVPALGALASRGDDPPERPARRGVALLDARGRPLRRAVVLEGADALHLWTDDPAEIPPGLWWARLVGEAGGWKVQVDAGRMADLGALGAVEVHLKDPQGVSLRFAPVVVEDGAGGQWRGRIGIPLTLPPGSWALSLPTLPGFERRIEIEGGEVLRLDLGVAGVLAVEDPAGAPPGSPALLWREDAPQGAPPLARAAVGMELLLPLGRYRQVVGDPPGAAHPAEARRKKKVKPSVAPRIVGADAP